MSSQYLTLIRRKTLSVIQHSINSRARMFSSQEIHSKFKEVSGIKFHYRETGGGDHAVLLLPGALGTSESDFQPQLEKMNKEKFHLIAIDPRGNGKSRPPERDFPLDFYNRDADDAAGLMAVLGHTSYSVLGWSDGGISAIILAAKYHDSLKKLVTFGGNAYYTSRDADIFEKTRDISKWSERMRDPMIAEYGEELFARMWSAWVDSVFQIIEEKRGDLCMAECRQIRKPTLILHGEKDPMVADEHPVYIQRHIMGSRLVRFPDGKHNIHKRYVDEFNRHVEGFLTKEE